MWEGLTVREASFCGRAGPAAGLCRLRAAAALRELPGVARTELRSRIPLPPFPAELQRQSTELPVNRKRDFFFFPPSCIRKQSDLAVLVICLQLS